MAAIMGQQNPMVQQFMGQAEQLEERINQINEGVGNFIKRQMKKDIVQIDLAKSVPNDVEALVIWVPMGRTPPGFVSSGPVHPSGEVGRCV